MSLKEKISINKYLLGTIVNGIIIFLYGAKTKYELKIMLLLLMVSMVNQLMLMLGVNLLLFTDPSEKRKNLKIFGLLIGKSVILGGGFYVALQNIPAKMLHCVVIYIFQLIILTLSIKRYSN